LNNSIIIDGEKFSAEDLMLLAGEDTIKSRRRSRATCF